MIQRIFEPTILGQDRLTCAGLALLIRLLRKLLRYHGVFRQGKRGQAPPARSFRIQGVAGSWQDSQCRCMLSSSFPTTSRLRCGGSILSGKDDAPRYTVHDPMCPVSYTHLRAHETGRNLVCRLLLEKKKKKQK